MEGSAKPGGVQKLDKQGKNFIARANRALKGMKLVKQKRQGTGHRSEHVQI